MTYYFGFLPTDKLNTMIDKVEHLVSASSNEPYYPLRNEISQQIARELIDNLLVSLVSVISNEERRASMTKVVITVENTTETMLGFLLGKDSNEDVLPNVAYLQNETLFKDNDGNRRVGFELDPKSAHIIIKGMDGVTPDHIDMPALREALDVMDYVVIDHFITRFCATLPLGLVKRKAIPVARSAIVKGLDMALNKMLPQLPNEALNRLVKFYRPFIVEKI